MKVEKEQLISDLLEDSGHREAILLAAGAVLRRRRQWRMARRSLASVASIAGIVLLLEHGQQRERVAPAPPLALQHPVAQQAQELTDAQLLSLFPNTPVALATLPNGKKLLIFPRAADEAKYVSRL